MTAQTTYNPSRCSVSCPCVIKADGTFLTGPVGWDAVRLSAGQYKITHRLARTDYIPIAHVSIAAVAGTHISAYAHDPTANDVLVTVTDGTAATDADVIVSLMML